MTIVKLPSGSYRIQQMVEGKRYSITVKEKPTEKLAQKLIAQKIANSPVSDLKADLTCFKNYARKYVNGIVQNVSPATTRSYEVIIRNLPEWFMETPISEIDSDTAQKMINEYGLTRSAKTTRCGYGFVSTVLRTYAPEKVLRVKLPKLVEKDDYIPTTEDIKLILDDIKGTEYEIPIRLACYGLRRGEILALNWPDDFEDNIVNISKTKVEDDNHNWIIKEPKTKDSIRKIWIDDTLLSLIKEKGYIYNGYPGKINQALQRSQKKLDIPLFSLHKLRHFFATELSQSGKVSEADILKAGGWSRKNSTVMKSVYRHARIDKDIESMKAVSNIISFD